MYPSTRGFPGRSEGGFLPDTFNQNMCACSYILLCFASQLPDTGFHEHARQSVFNHNPDVSVVTCCVCSALFGKYYSIHVGLFVQIISKQRGTRLGVASHPCLQEASWGSQGLVLHVVNAPSCFKSGLQLTVDRVMSYMRGCRIGLRLHVHLSSTRCTIPPTEPRA